MNWDNYNPHWTEEEAKEAGQAWITERRRVFEQTGEDRPGEESPYIQWRTHHSLADLETKFKAGDKSAIMEALNHCAWSDRPMPDWLARAVKDAFRAKLRFEFKSWDEVLGSPLPRGRHQKSLQRDRDLPGRIYYYIQRMREEQPKRAIDNELFEEVGERFKIGKTKTQEYYLWYKGWLNDQ